MSKRMLLSALWLLAALASVGCFHNDHDHDRDHDHHEVHDDHHEDVPHY